MRKYLGVKLLAHMVSLPLNSIRSPGKSEVEKESGQEGERREHSVVTIRTSGNTGQHLKLGDKLINGSRYT